MDKYVFGNESADIVLIQLVDDHDLKLIENEYKLIKENTNKDFMLLALKANNWNDDLSPWYSDPVFGNVPFRGLADNTLEEVLKCLSYNTKKYYIGGYSLAGLFALYASYKTNVFSGVVAASPSLWYKDFISFMKNNKINADNVYLSLGDKEEKTKNIIMQSVGNNIKEAFNILESNNINTILEWNQGNHFMDADIRTAKGFIWIINN